MAKAPKKLKKIKIAELWSKPKKLAAKNFKEYLKTARKESKGDKEELSEIKDEEKRFKEMMGRFNAGLSPTLKTLDKADTADDQLKYAEDAKKIVVLYKKVVNKYQDLPEPKKVRMFLVGALSSIEKKSDECIKFIKKNR